MICPNCGRNIPDGTVCPCGQGQSLYSSNPAVNALKTVGASPKFLVFTILCTAAMLLSMFAVVNTEALMPLLNNIFNELYQMGVSPQVLSAVMESVRGDSAAGAVTASVPSILSVVALWITFISCRNKQTGNVSTAGLTICKVMAWIQLVALCIGSVALIFGGIVIFAASGRFASEFFGYNRAESTVIVIVLAAILVIALIELVLSLIYQSCLIKTVNRVKSTAMTGVPDDRIPRFLIVMNYITAVAGILGSIPLFAFSPMSALSTLCSSVAYILISLCLSQYRRAMTALVSQPVYMPPVQPPILPMQ